MSSVFYLLSWVTSSLYSWQSLALLDGLRNLQPQHIFLLKIRFQCEIQEFPLDDLTQSGCSAISPLNHLHRNNFSLFTVNGHETDI